MVSKLLQNVLDKKEKSAELGRLLPVDFLCAPTLDAFTALAESHIKPIFGTEEKVTWALQFRVGTSFHRDMF